MNEFYESVDKNFEYVGSTKDVSLYKYYDSKILFNEMKNNRPRFDEALKKQEELQKKKNEVKMGNKTPGQKK